MPLTNDNRERIDDDDDDVKRHFEYEIAMTLDVIDIKMTAS